MRSLLCGARVFPGKQFRRLAANVVESGGSSAGSMLIHCVMRRVVEAATATAVRETPAQCERFL